MSDPTYAFLSGLVLGAVLATAYSIFLMVHQDRRHRNETTLLRRSFDPELQNLPDPKAPIAFDDPDMGLNTEWVKHTPYHWTCLLCGDKLQYWPTKNKWRWRYVTYDGGANGVPVDNVEDFMQRRIREEYE